MTEPQRLRVLQDCLGWTTTMKKGQLISDANAKPVELKAGEEVTAQSVALDVAPRTLFVTHGDATIEVREAFLGA